MNEKYEIPEIETICLECQDIVTGSNDETPFVPFNLNTAEENSTF